MSGSTISTLGIHKSLGSVRPITLGLQRNWFWRNDGIDSQPYVFQSEVDRSSHRIRQRRQSRRFDIQDFCSLTATSKEVREALRDVAAGLPISVDLEFMEAVGLGGKEGEANVVEGGASTILRGRPRCADLHP